MGTIIEPQHRVTQKKRNAFENPADTVTVTISPAVRPLSSLHAATQIVFEAASKKAKPRRLRCAVVFSPPSHRAAAVEPLFEDNILPSSQPSSAAGVSSECRRSTVVVWLEAKPMVEKHPLSAWEWQQKPRVRGKSMKLNQRKVTDIIIKMNGKFAMVARGDLGAELPIEEIPLLQLMATNMLESMIVHPTPTRAEFVIAGMDDPSEPFMTLQKALKDDKRIRYHRDYLSNLSNELQQFKEQYVCQWILDVANVRKNQKGTPEDLRRHSDDTPAALGGWDDGKMLSSNDGSTAAARWLGGEKTTTHLRRLGFAFFEAASNTIWVAAWREDSGRTAGLRRRQSDDSRFERDRHCNSVGWYLSQSRVEVSGADDSSIKKQKDYVMHGVLAYARMGSWANKHSEVMNPDKHKTNEAFHSTHKTEESACAAERVFSQALKKFFRKAAVVMLKVKSEFEKLGGKQRRKVESDKGDNLSGTKCGK
ncbi:hypothetical protein V8G54_008896 [Vigna mungo]|uniref:pyruvate kinase n=1 Tax=Vigna mungo TaxID=3915 RepID=A0AAQ3SAG5_VIGMU